MSIKTLKNKASVKKFIESVENEERKKDAFTLLEIFEKITKEKATMWGTSIIGFGEYHYKSTRSKQEGDWPLTGFSPRKQSLSIYIMSGVKQYPELLKKLGPHKTGVSCLYIKRLSEIHLPTLKEMIKKDFKHMQSGKKHC